MQQLKDLFLKLHVIIDEHQFEAGIIATILALILLQLLF